MLVFFGILAACSFISAGFSVWLFIKLKKEI